MAALWDAEPREAERVVSEAMDAGWSSQDIYQDLFASALYEIGAWWEADSCTVADEHGARVITERVMADVSDATGRRSPQGRQVVVACVEGEQHELGARMVADMFLWSGWTVRLLGANTPAAELVDEARRRGPGVIALSATMQPSWRAIKLQIADLRAVGTRAVLLGGQAFGQLDQDDVRALGATAKANRAFSGVELANALLDGEDDR